MICQKEVYRYIRTTNLKKEKHRQTKMVDCLMRIHQDKKDKAAWNIF
jgi:hypothetical protein